MWLIFPSPPPLQVQDKVGRRKPGAQTLTEESPWSYPQEGGLCLLSEVTSENQETGGLLQHTVPDLPSRDTMRALGQETRGSLLAWACGNECKAVFPTLSQIHQT